MIALDAQYPGYGFAAPGFDSVFGLKGGMAGWGQAGLPVVTGKKTKAKKAKKAKKK